MTTRRQFIATSAALGSITLLPYAAMAAGHASDTFQTANGSVTVHPIAHASFVMETPSGTIYVDPVGDASAYADMPAPDMILITHEHGDHFNLDTLTAIAGDNTVMLSNPAVFDMLPADMQAKTTSIANGEDTMLADVGIIAVPAYNTTEDRLNFHPKGRDNGYVVTIDGMRIYISGDTEGTPEMRALENIDVAFVCMNLPFTMDAKAAAEAVSEFAPTYVYPYHYRGRDNGTQDPAEFANMLTGAIEAKMGGWYG
ncbi:MAG: L-ascorbate metabolism protein UlaG (beta-lactamase superfamily) [Yoonia sp.]|jgi:L-ascorbate metabolism protein UlaG (beta-lactamase superfamily)